MQLNNNRDRKIKRGKIIDKTTNKKITDLMLNLRIEGRLEPVDVLYF